MATAIQELTRLEGTDQTAEHGGAGAKINEMVQALNAMVVGQATVLSGNDSVTVAAATLGGLYEDKPAMAVLAFIDATALYVKACTWSGDDLIITLNANATLDTLVTYMVDGRV